MEIRGVAGGTGGGAVAGGWVVSFHILEYGMDSPVLNGVQLLVMGDRTRHSRAGDWCC